MKKIIPLTLVVIGFLVGATALSALAEWSAPLSSPPTCVSGNPGCDAPINASASEQTKRGPAIFNFNNTALVGLKTLGKFQMVDGSQGDGKVLTSNADGIATWQNPGSGGSTTSSTTPVAYFYWNYDTSGDKIGDKYNIGTVTRNATDPSIVTVTFQNPLAANGYLVTCNGGAYFGEYAPMWTNAYEKTTTGFKVRGFYVASRDASPYTFGSLSCVVYGGTEAVTYGNDNGANKIASFAQGTQYIYDDFGSVANDITEAVEDLVNPPTPGGAVSNSITLNTSNTYRVTYTYNPVSGVAPNIRFVNTNTGRGANGSNIRMANVTGTGAVGTTDYQAVSGTNSFTFTPTATTGYLEISIGSSAVTNFSMSDITLTIN